MTKNSESYSLFLLNCPTEPHYEELLELQLDNQFDETSSLVRNIMSRKKVQKPKIKGKREATSNASTSVDIEYSAVGNATSNEYVNAMKESVNMQYNASITSKRTIEEKEKLISLDEAYQSLLRELGYCNVSAVTGCAESGGTAGASNKGKKPISTGTILAGEIPIPLSVTANVMSPKLEMLYKKMKAITKLFTAIDITSLLITSVTTDAATGRSNSIMFGVGADMSVTGPEAVRTDIDIVVKEEMLQFQVISDSLRSQRVCSEDSCSSVLNVVCDTVTCRVS